MLVLQLRFSVGVVAVRAEWALFVLRVETTHYRLVLAWVRRRQPRCSRLLRAARLLRALFGLSCLLGRLNLFCGCGESLEDLLIKLGASLRKIIGRLVDCVCFAGSYFENNFIPTGIIITASLRIFCGGRRLTAGHSVIRAGASARTLRREAPIVSTCFQVAGCRGARRRVVVRGVAAGTCASLSCIA